MLLDFFAYFATLTASRREHPTEDLASAIANGRIDGEPLSDMDTASYYVIVASAGHDTTKDAISGGLRALIENPGELERLRNDPDLMPTAVEEMIRWSTPVKEFMRTAAADTTVRGVADRQGRIGLSGLCFRQPRRGGVRRPVPLRRRPRPEQARGVRLRRALLPRCRAGADGDEQPFHRAGSAAGVDRTGRRARATATTFVGGLKHLPIRYSLR